MAPPAEAPPPADFAGALSPDQAARTFVYVVDRVVPVAEAMMACVLADAKLRHRGQTGR